MSSNGSDSARTSAPTQSTPETMYTSTTTPEPLIRSSQDIDNESLETVESLQERNKWSEDQMTRMGKKINQQSIELAEKDQVISRLRTGIENFNHHWQREIESQEEQLEEKTKAFNNMKASVGGLREELRKVKCSGEWAQVSNTRAREALEKQVAESEGIVQTLRETMQMMQDRLEAQKGQMKDYHGQEARIFELKEEIQYLDKQLMDGEIKKLEKSITRHSFSIRASKLKTTNKRLKITIKKLRAKIIRQQDIITQRDDIITEQEYINENQYRDSARKILCDKNYIAMQQAKEAARRLLCNKNCTAMQDATFEKQQKDHARELLCAKNYITIQHATIDQHNKDEARRLRWNRNYVAKQEAFIKSLETQFDDALSKTETFMIEHDEWRPEMEEMQKKERELYDENMCLMEDIIDRQVNNIEELEASRKEALNAIEEALMTIRQA